jgi:hypothetical protein
VSTQAPRFPFSRLFAVVVAALAAGSCSVATMRTTSSAPPTAEQMAQLWVEPEDPAARDLFWGPGGPEGAPASTDVFRVTALDETGYSRGYDVVGRAGREWKVKLGPEAQSEIVASRVLWALGFHQPAMYGLESWTLDAVRAPRAEGVARFRLKEGYRTRGTWSWQENPFVGTREFKGLLVAQLLLNNWDLKTSNNRIYAVAGVDETRRTFFVVQDLGAALGATRWPTGTRNNLAHFERQQFIKGVRPDGIIFDYGGRHRELFQDIVPSDVVWTCRRLSQLTDRQWLDIFRAARYTDAISAHYIAKLQSKIHEGLAMLPQSGNDF